MLDPMTTGRSILCLAALVAGLAGCAPTETAEEPIVLETEDIGPAEPELDLSNDEVARRTSRGRGGQLPVGFPEGMPLYQPSTIVDIGEGGTGGYVLFETPAKRAVVESWLRSELGRSGWSITSDAGEMWAASRGSWSVGISVSDAGSGTAIRIEY